MNDNFKKKSVTKMVEIEKSKEMFEIAKELTPGGVHSNVRWSRIDPHPIYYAKAKGSRIWDVDGNEYIDCLQNMGALILGHGDPDVAEAVKKQLENGLTATVETELSIETAKKLKKMVPCAEKLRFTSTGTEAVMHAIHIARGFTGREKIVKAEGCYDGWYDYVFTSIRPPLEMAGPKLTPRPVPGSSGLSRDSLDKTLVVPWNNLDSVEKMIKNHGEEIAAVIIEPVAHNMGCALPREGYLEGLREITEDNNILLIFDEVITGFRSAPGGAQEFFGVTPDLATYAKAIANGFPLAAVCGKANIMDIIEPHVGSVAFGGTYNGNQIPLAAASATLDKLKDGEIQKYMNKSTEKMMREFNSTVEGLNVEARLQGFGSIFQVYFTDEEVVDFRTASTSDAEKYRKFTNLMREGCILFGGTGCFYHHGITAAHSKDDIDKILATAESALREIR